MALHHSSRSPRGIDTDALDREIKWDFTPTGKFKQGDHSALVV